MTAKIPCTVEILTLNSERTLGRCLESVRDFDDIIVLDGNSTDGTVALAKSYGARVFPQTDGHGREMRIDDFSRVRNLGIALARHQWFTFIDSDEYLSAEAADEVRRIVERPDERTPRAFKRPRRYVLDGEVIERSTTYPNYQMRLFFLPAVKGFVKKVHESIKLQPGTVIGTLSAPEYVPLDPINVTRKKWSRYLDIQQEALRELTFRRLLKGMRSNSIKTLKYVVKYCVISVVGSGKRMPFPYEFSNALYHVRLMGRMIENYCMRVFRHHS